MPANSTVEQQYELTFILGEKANQEEGKAKTTELKDLIKKMGGSVSKEELWGRRELAYPIKRNRSGFYTTLWFAVNPDQIKGLERNLRFDESIIRSLVTKAYTTAQPGNLYPVNEEEKTEKASQASKEEKTSAEEMLRRTASKKTEQASTEEEEIIPEEERLKKLDETLEELLKDEE